MDTVILVMSDEEKATELGADVKDFTFSLLEAEELDGEVKTFDSKYYVKSNKLFDTSPYSGFIIETVEKFPDDEVLDKAFETNTIMNEEGFALYRKIISDVQVNNGLSSSTDESIAQYEAMTEIRNMLKDGLFLWALRQFKFNIAPGFPQELADKYTAWMSDISKKYGFTDEEVTAMLTVPKGSL